MKSEDLGLPIFYQEYPEYFDTPSNHYNTDEKNQAVERLLKKYGAHRVFDMTCGTGAQVFYLAQRGYEVVGSDFSTDLIKIAQEKAVTVDVPTKLRVGDMRDVYQGEFDAVITIDNAIGHLVKADFDVALQNIHKNLKPGGFYLFDILNLEAMTDEVIAADAEKMTDKRKTHDGAEIYNVRETSIDRQSGYLTSMNYFTIHKNGEEKRVENKCTLQIYTKDQLRKLLAERGFDVVEQFSADAFTFHQDDSGYSIITVAKKG